MTRLVSFFKAFEVKDTAATRQMVQQMQQEGVPVTKENVKAFESVMRDMPQGVNKEEWLQAAVLASKKGLPLTPTTVDAVKQVTTWPSSGAGAGETGAAGYLRCLSRTRHILRRIPPSRLCR